MTDEEKAEFLLMVQYYWTEKGDPTRYSDWDDALVQKEFPVLWRAWSDYLAARNMLNIVIKGMQP